MLKMAEHFVISFHPFSGHSYTFSWKEVLFLMGVESLVFLEIDYEVQQHRKGTLFLPCGSWIIMSADLVSLMLPEALVIIWKTG